MKPFSKNEVIGTVAILAIIALATFSNLRLAMRRARDVQRRTDLDVITGALEKYQADYGFFPPSENGKLKACRGENFEEQLLKVRQIKPFDWEEFFKILKPCVWGKDALADLFDASYSPYLMVIPADPKAGIGNSYLYISNTKRFQIYGYLEGEEEEIGFREEIVTRGLSCGNKVCNFGRAYGVTPLDKSIEEYENELLEQQKAK